MVCDVRAGTNVLTVLEWMAREHTKVHIWLLLLLLLLLLLVY